MSEKDILIKAVDVESITEAMLKRGEAAKLAMLCPSSLKPAPDMTTLKPKKIKIVWTSFHCCIRVIKMAKALMATGRYEIHGIANQVSYGTQFMDTFSFYHNAVQFNNLINALPADLYIHSNEPNWQLTRIREQKPDAKIILDGHDFDSIRQGAIPLDEMRAFTNANGIIFVSKKIKDYICTLHEDQINVKPTTVIEHYCNEEWHKIPQPSANQRSGLVYQGGAESPPYKTNQFRYRHLYPVLKQMVDQGNEIHLIAGNGDASATYANIGAFCYQPMVYEKLMAALRSKRWGLVVFNNEDLSQKQVNLTLTNKHFEYIACGLPVIVCGAPATAEWVKKTGEGICFDRFKDITPKILDEAYPACKAVVDKIAPEYTMEKHIHKLESLISAVL